ncbi:MAG TPA: hypothetical protein VKG65_01300 [Terriglobales bacterium]|nr:hypothetical protein [Terriglobales bacterium]
MMASMAFGIPAILVSGAVGLILAVVHRRERPLLVMSAAFLLMLLAFAMVIADKISETAFAAWFIGTVAILIFFCVRWFGLQRRATGVANGR